MGNVLASYGITAKDLSDINLSTKRLGAELNPSALTKVHQLVLQQYPYLKGIYESMLVTDVKLPDGPIVYANDYFEKMSLYPKEEILGRNCRFMQGPLTNKETVKQVRQAVDAGEQLDVEILNYRKDGIPFWNNFLMLPVLKKKKLRYFVAIQKNISFLKKASKVDEWSAPEVAMFFSSKGLDKFARIFIDKNVTGKKLLALNIDKLVKLNIFLRQDTKAILDIVEDLKEKGEALWSEQSNTAADYTRASTTLDSTEKFDSSAPAQLQFWNRKEDFNTVCIKLYYQDHIELILVRKPITYFSLKSQVCSILKLEKVNLTGFKDNGSLVPLKSQVDLDMILEQEGTIKILVQPDTLDITVLSTFLHQVVNPSLLISMVTSENDETISQSKVSFDQGRSIGAKKWVISYVNRAMEDLLKSTNNKIVGENIRAVFPFIEVDNLPSQPCSTYVINTFSNSLVKKKAVDAKKFFEEHGVRVILSTTKILSDLILFQINLDGDPISYSASKASSILRHSSSGSGFDDSPKSYVNDCDKQSLRDEEDPPKLENIPTADDSEHEDTFESEESLSHSSSNCSKGEKETQKAVINLNFTTTLEKVIIEESNVYHNTLRMMNFIMVLDCYNVTSHQVLLSLENINDHLKKLDAVLYKKLSNRLEKFVNLWVTLRGAELLAGKVATKLIEFYRTVSKNTNNRSFELNLLRLKKERKQEIDRRNRHMKSTPILAPTIETNSILLTMNPKKLAAAITALDWNTFSKINPSEFAERRWQSDNKHELAPHLAAMADRSNQLSHWIGINILTCNGGEQGLSRAIKHVIDLASQLLLLNNMESLATVISALSLASVSRLKAVWNRVPSSYTESLKQFESLVSSYNNYFEYRELIRCNIADSGDHMPKTPTIPLLSVTLRDIFFFSVNHAKAAEAADMDKIFSLGEVIKNTLIFQKTPYKLEVDEMYVMLARNMVSNVDEDTLWKQSNQVFPSKNL